MFDKILFIILLVFQSLVLYAATYLTCIVYNLSLTVFVCISFVEAAILCYIYYPLFKSVVDKCENQNN